MKNKKGKEASKFKVEGKYMVVGMKDFVILCIAVLISVVLLVELGFIIPAAITLCYAFLTIRKDEITILDFRKYDVRYFLSEQQYFEWR